jgi:hypothetical protein
MGSGSKAQKRLFTETAEYIKKNLFGELPGQAEQLLADSPYRDKIKFWSMYISGVTPNGASSLVADDKELFSPYVLPRRDAVVAMMTSLHMNPDVVFMVTQSKNRYLSHSWGTTDDDSRPGVATTYDGSPLIHRYYHETPGTVAFHVNNAVNRNMTAAHEFGHAFSSYTNGFIADLYHDSDGPHAPPSAHFNRKVGRPIPNSFAGYDGTTYRSDKNRKALGGYGSDCPATYHPELVDPNNPALMDKFQEGGMSSRHDKITKAYVMDRVSAKVSR